MANVAYPSVLPTPQLSAFQGQMDDNVYRTEVDGGPARQHLEYADVQETNNYEIVVSNTFFQVFRFWYEKEINFGQDFFDVTLKIGGRNITTEARFEGTYNYSQISDKYWRIGFIIRLRDHPVISQNEYDRLTGTYRIPAITSFTISGINIGTLVREGDNLGGTRTVAFSVENSQNIQGSNLSLGLSINGAAEQRITNTIPLNAVNGMWNVTVPSRVIAENTTYTFRLYGTDTHGIEFSKQFTFTPASLRFFEDEFEEEFE